MRRLFVTLFTLSLVAMQSAVSAAAPLDLVNPLQGTDSNIGLSYGSTLPLVAMPWGMTNWAPQTDSGWGWWFRYTSNHIQGIRATRQPSPWMGDYGQFLLMPQTGPLITNAAERQSPYDRDASTFRPDYLKLDLPRYDVGLELTASERCSVLRLDFRSGDTGRLIVDPAGTSHVEVVGRTIRGWSTATSGGELKHFKAYFVVQLDRDLTGSGTFTGSNKDFREPAERLPSLGGYVEFATGQNRTVIVKVGTSYIGFEQAEQNLKNETADGFDGVRRKSSETWAANLAKIEVNGGTDDQRKTFFSCLYRAQLFPHKIYELDAAGNQTHYSPFDGKVHPGILYTDNGFWDVYRTNYPFWSILFPEQLGEILHGFENAYLENGWFPQWPSPGDRVSMIGTHVDAVYADAVVKGIKGFDVATAYEGIRKDAFEVPPRNNVGRPALKHYLEEGYVPGGHDGYSASTSLDYAYDDWCVAQVAKALGKTDDYEALMKRSKNYKASWDPKVGFFRPRDAEGAFMHEPFDEFGWSNGYVEGGPWQCSWAVQHDIDGLAELMGGKKAMGEKLDQLMGLPPVFHVGGYGNVIHEMTEMANSRFGQYAQSNQPSHHILYLFSAIGQPWKTEYWTRKVCEELYNSGPHGFPGDEDNGEMSCWFLLSSMGFYPLCVGDPHYTLTSPLFDEVTLHLPNGKTFTIKTDNNGKHNVFVRSRTLNGQPFIASTISHEQIVGGGEMVMEMSQLAQAQERKHH